jgi:hypothetical protein
MDYPEKLIKDYQNYMLKNGVKVSRKEANEDLKSLSIFYQSFALDEHQKNK